MVNAGYNSPMFELEVSKRERTGKHSLKILREEGFLPAVVYGRKEKSTAIKINQHDFEMLFKKTGESSIISLKGLKEEKEVLIHDIDYDPITSIPRHVDFYAIEKGKKLHTKVPIEFIGVSPAVKELGGVLTKSLHELEIEVLPRDLPQHIEVDISKIVDFNDQLLVKDLMLPEGVIMLTGEDEVIASAHEAVEEVIEEVVPADLEGIEVEQKGKGEDGDGGEEGEGGGKDTASTAPKTSKQGGEEETKKD